MSVRVKQPRDFGDLQGPSFDNGLCRSSGYVKLRGRGDSHSDLIIKCKHCRQGDICRDQDRANNQHSPDFEYWPRCTHIIRR
jgi:hypothetical protein